MATYAVHSYVKVNKTTDISINPYPDLNKKLNFSNTFHDVFPKTSTNIYSKHTL